MERQVREKVFEKYHNIIEKMIIEREKEAIKNKNVFVLVPFASSKNEIISYFDNTDRVFQEIYNGTKFIFFDDFPNVLPTTSLKDYLDQHKSMTVKYEVDNNKGSINVWYYPMVR